MGECMNAVDAPAIPFRGLLGDSLGGMIDAAHRVEHPQLVARSDASVGAAIAIELRLLAAGCWLLVRYGRICVVEHARQRPPKIVRMHPISGGDRRARESDWNAVLHYLLIDRHVR